MTCTIGGALEHQKVQNHQKLKCSKNALFIHQTEPLGKLFPMSTISVSFWCIGGALEHLKVQNHQKLKCSKNALFIHQIVALGQLFQMSTILVSFWSIGGALEHQKVQNHQKLKCSKNALFIHQNDPLGELFPMSTILVSFWCIGGVLEHQKVQIIRNWSALKSFATKRAHSSERADQALQFGIWKVHFWCTSVFDDFVLLGAPMHHQCTKMTPKWCSLERVHREDHFDHQNFWCIKSAFWMTPIFFVEIFFDES